MCHVELLGKDPLSVVSREAEKTPSKLYSSILTGYVFTVKSGGNIVNFFNAKMRFILDQLSSATKNSVEKLKTLVESYMVTLVLTLGIYLIFGTIYASTNIAGRVIMTPIPESIIYFATLFLIPMISILFLIIAQTARQGTFLTIREPYKVAIIPTIGVMIFAIAIVYLPQLTFISKILGAPFLTTLCLLAVSVFPSLTYSKIARLNFAAEKALPDFIRGIAEARKTGLSPEKCIMNEANRNYGLFSRVVKSMENQLRLGIPLRKIFANIRSEIRSWPVLMELFLLIETIEVGGGHGGTLDTLADFSQKMQGIENEKRATLRPYIIFPFIGVILLAFTTIVTLQMLSAISFQMLQVGHISFVNAQLNVDIFAVAIILQSWLTGFFLGKVTEGSFAAGFKFASLLVVTAYLTILLSTFSPYMAFLTGGIKV
jgi:flagellar protein FlaJ